MPPDNERILSPEQCANLGLMEAPAAQKNMDLLRRKLGNESFSSLLPSLVSGLASAADPDMALNNLERFVDAMDNGAAFTTLCRTNPDTLRALITICGASRFLSTFLVSLGQEGLRFFEDPAFFSALADQRKLRDRLDAMLARAENDRQFASFLRIFRKQEMLRIGLRDLLGKADLQETVGDLSALAEVCLQRANERVLHDLVQKHGRPLEALPEVAAAPAGFAVLAMGKLGGRELNFSSDIDLMYVYSADGETEGSSAGNVPAQSRITTHQFFVKAAERLTAMIGETTEDGFVFRVDLRLRPEGRQGPLAQSLGGYEIYYESWGQTWERAALLKARPVAGDEAAGREFLVRITPFVFRKYLDFSAIAEIREMKQKINRDVQQKGREFRDVKLGYGGIREIEFLVQALQLIYAGRDRALREKSTLKALHRLSQKGLISYEEHAELSKAYVFLRNVEHRIQILDDRQTQTMPSDEPGLRALARRLGYRTAGSEAESLLRDYADHTRKVRTVYDRLFAQEAADAPPVSRQDDSSLLLDPQTSETELIAVFQKYGFQDPARAHRNLMLLREGRAFVHQTPRGRRVFSDTFPVLFTEIVQSPDPDMALNHLESFLAAQGSWDAFQSFLQQAPLAVKSLIAIFANSEYFSRMLVRSPALFQDMLDTNRAQGGAAGAQARFRTELSSLMSQGADAAEKLDLLRRFKLREEIRIGMADLLAASSPKTFSRSLSLLAEACVCAALDLASAETTRRFGGDAGSTGLAVMAVGKLGGRELTYASDLDLLFVAPDGTAAVAPSGLSPIEYCSRIAEKTISYLSTMTREGFAYRIDTRLRPGGSKGPLVQTIEAFRSHYSAIPGVWERQAMLNIRTIAGDDTTARAFCEIMQPLIFRESEQAALAEEIRSMRRRMEDELGKESETQYNIKQGPGGLVDIEFIVQYLQLLQGRDDHAVRAQGTHNALRTLRKQGQLVPEDHQLLSRAHVFLRTLESRMRIVANQATDMMSRNADALRPLARRMGYGNDQAPEGERLLADYESLRRMVREAFVRILR